MAGGEKNEYFRFRGHRKGTGKGGRETRTISYSLEGYCQTRNMFFPKTITSKIENLKTMDCGVRLTRETQNED